ncbi:ORF6C domain-containing protein [Priestia megaterium]|uniref:ORF6C domain-containing protein n=1 Tax=Priestia megaterium TaxID=1404 RepID=UPI003F5C1569
MSKINELFQNKGKTKSFCFFAGKESSVYKDNSIRQKVLRKCYDHFLSARDP